jgi:hypothetical protein
MIIYCREIKLKTPVKYSRLQMHRAKVEMEMQSDQGGY